MKLLPGVVPEINKPELRIIAGVYPIPNDAVESFDFVVDEFSHLPRCVIRFKDFGEKRLASMAGLGIGAPITFNIVEGDVSNLKYKVGKMTNGITNLELTPLAISKIHSTGDAGNLGHVELLLEHPWKMFMDFSSHAYAGDANSEIIRKLVENAEGRGFDFEDIDSKMFFSSDEDGSIPRYKCGEGDYDFILNRVLPYTTINKYPAEFWVDELNRVHLDTYKNMYASDPKAVIFFGSEADVNDDVISAGASTNGLAFARSKLVKIGTDDPSEIISIMKPCVSIDDVSHLLTYTGNLFPKIAGGKFKKGLADKSHIPIMFEPMAMNDATAKKVYRNRPLSDLKALAMREQEPFNSLFTIEVETTFCGNLVQTGDNVQLYIPNDKTQTPPAKHWANGKWHVRAIRYTYDRGVLLNTLTLCRPSFDINKLNTSVTNIDDYYAVGMVFDR